jgi:LmbE family N-acetylglucosaminyl deacetylase
MRKVLYLLAHPDDELMCLPLLLRAGSENYLSYISLASPNESVRLKEAHAAISYLSLRGVSSSFFSLPFVLKDGISYLEIDNLKINDLIDVILKLNPSEIVTFDYEGGHQDHDLASVIGFILANRLSLPIKYFSGYRSTGFAFFFKIMKPIARDAGQRFEPINVLRVTLGLLNVYRSQWHTWIFLSPSLLFSYFMRSWHISVGNLKCRIIPSSYLYQNRGKAERESVESKLSQLLEHNNLGRFRP